MPADRKPFCGRALSTTDWFLQEVQNEFFQEGPGRDSGASDVCEHVKTVGLGLLADNWVLSIINRVDNHRVERNSSVVGVFI